MILAASPGLNRFYAEIIDKGGLRMTCEIVIALVTCVATVICTVIAVLSYFRNKR